MDTDTEQHAFRAGQLDEQLFFAAEPGLVGLEGRGQRGEVAIGMLVGFGGGGEAPVPAAEGPVGLEPCEEAIEQAGELVVQAGNWVVDHCQGEVELVGETPVGGEADDSADDDPGGTGRFRDKPDEIGDEAGTERQKAGVTFGSRGDLRGEPVGEDLECFVEEGIAGREEGRVGGGVVAEVGRAEGEELVVTWSGGEEGREIGGRGTEGEAVRGRSHAAIPGGARRGGSLTASATSGGIAFRTCG